jgi:thiosulfate dehydrogenase [quinone] large subunit
MSITSNRTPIAPQQTDTVGQAQEPRSDAVRVVLGLLRLVVGWTFLWAFFDKLLALGFSTGRNPETGAVDRFGDAAWINGGEPTYGFLAFGAKGPFADFYAGIAGAAWADWLFMAGLLGIGVAFTLGIVMNLAAVSAAVMYVLMWTVVLAPENNPITDDHIMGAFVVAALALLSAGRHLGLGRRWESTTLVQRVPLLK